MDEDTRKNKPELDNKETPKPETDSLLNVPFKKPTVLVGKLGRLPRKVQTIPPVAISSHKAPVVSAEKPTALEDTVNPTDPLRENVPEAPLLEKPLEEPKEAASKSPAQLQAEISIPLPYKEPCWSGLPETNGKPYAFEVLKNGSIIETINLMKKPFWVFGRLANCDICMQHPTISRYHAVIQYRDVPAENDPPGFYIYDMGSTHGTFLNGKNNKLKPKIYVPVRVGHMIRLGCSQRSYILLGPEDDQEKESELSVTELKQRRDQKIKEHEEKMRQAELEREEKRRREEERGVDWGMGDDADDMEDLLENPYASTTNEELYLDDPKKALRGFFEREGLEFEYDCSEQGMGQFMCKVELPLDDEMGRPIVAEVLHRGKKKEAVVQCALEACRILDRFGVLRQATHESKKRKAKNWEENDYYDSDEDTFLDRTGSIEKKREKRMKVKESDKAETYESLLEKEKNIVASMAEIEKKLSRSQASLDEARSDANTEEDPLDSYMKGLSADKPDKQTVSKLKLELATLKRNHSNVIRLVNIARPANLPPLTPAGTSESTSSANKNKRNFPIFGKRRVVPVKFPAKPSTITTGIPEPSTELDEEEDESDNETENMQSVMDSKLSEQPPSLNDASLEVNRDEKTSSSETSGNEIQPANNPTINLSNTAVIPNEQNNDPANTRESGESQDLAESASDSSDDGPVEILHEFRPIHTLHHTDTFKKFEKIMKGGLPAVADKHKQKLVKILRRLQRLASNEDRMHTDWKTLAAKKRKVMKWISELRQSESNEKLEFRVSTELNRILNELNIMTEDKCKVIGQVKQMGLALRTISTEIDQDIQDLKKGMSDADSSDISRPGSSKEVQQTETDKEISDELTEEVDEKKKKKNQKRNELRQHKAELERRRGYEEDASRENYNMWVPPNDQSGDGRTSLNDKFGY